MPPIRNLTSPNDRFGPATAVRARLSRTGNGAALIVKGNPFSFKLSDLGACIPFLSLMGNRTPASAQARQALLNGQDPSSSLDPAASKAATNDPSKPAANPPSPPPAAGAGAGNIPNPVGGPWSYVAASKTGHY